ncbi:MAG: DUF4920 domain-containing protein [Acidobacteria bacterium]|nr:DUF4920 domain-containing protein [Acidobacteriota bacterium]
MKKIVIAMAVAAASLTGVAAQTASPQKFGTGVSNKDAVAIGDLYATTAKFVGKKIRVDGVVTDVCTDMGCWMAIASEQEPTMIVRIKVEDGGPIIFPVSAKGKKVSAEGVFEKVKADDKEAMEAAADQKAGAKAEMFGKTYQLKGTGAYVY